MPRHPRVCTTFSALGVVLLTSACGDEAAEDRRPGSTSFGSTATTTAGETDAGTDGSATSGSATATGTTSGSTTTASSSGDPTSSSGTTGEPGEAQYTLRLNDDPPEPIDLSLDKQGVLDLFGERAEELLLIELDSTPVLTDAFTQIKTACGTDWQRDTESPVFDCTVTPLGQQFMGPDGTWRSSAEFALVRILTMTPANVSVTGTTSESLANLANDLELGGGYSDILADALGISRTTEIVSTANVVAAFQNHFLASHPAFNNAATIPVTLWDALQDLRTLGAKFGPSGSHPGITDPTFPTEATVFTPEFRMRVIGESNLKIVDGVDLDAGEKGFLSTVFDTTGPAFDDEVEFDFNDPNKFNIFGLADEIRIDLKIRVTEDPAFVPACTQAGCVMNMPGAPVGSNTVWRQDRWEFEYNVADAALRQYGNLRFSKEYRILGGLIRAATIEIGQNGNPPGWIQYSTFAGLGSPPAAQYVWETIMEIAQVALHNPPGVPAIPEGQANPGAVLFDVDLGLTGAQAEERIRPFLQAQRSLVSEFILGDFKKNNQPLEFFYGRASDNQPYLFFTTADDLPEGTAYPFDKPGFFRDPGLTDKASSTAQPGVGDDTHEKLRLSPGETVVYVQDATLAVHRLRFVVDAADESEIEVFASRP
jgi:hypothetical protein